MDMTTTGVESSRLHLLETLKEFTESAVGDLILPLNPKSERGAERKERTVEVYLMRLPNNSSSTKKAPYILHQFVTGKDVQEAGRNPVSSAVVRTVFCVYCETEDEAEGALILLNLMERLRIALLKTPNIGHRYLMDKSEGMETLVYPEQWPPYYMGEMISAWKLPAVKEEIKCR